MSPEAFVPCKAESGFYPDERGIIFKHPETGDIIAAIVPQERVITEEEPRPGGQVDGKLRVEAEEKGNSVVIDLQPLEMVQGKAKQKVPLAFVKEE